MAVFIGMLHVSETGYAGVLGNNTEAQGCAVAVGGAISSSTVTNNCGFTFEQVQILITGQTKPLEELNAAQKDTIVQIRKTLNINEAQLRSALNTLGEKDVPSEQMVTRLVEIAQQFRGLRASAKAQPEDDVEITALKNQVGTAIETGDRDLADRLLIQIEAHQGEAQGRLMAARADTRAQRGNVALAGLH